MEGVFMIVKSLEWIGGTDGYLEILDQRRLPSETVRLNCKNVEDVFEAIKHLAVRGAPAIGVTVSYGLVLALRETQKDDKAGKGLYTLNKAAEYLVRCRPTAVNLKWAVDRIKQKAVTFVRTNPETTSGKLHKIVLAEANAIRRQDIRMCRKIGENGQRFICEGAGILTHCNAGALATAGQGTALSVMFEAQKKGKKFKVYADETRPLLQGARLTAWELKQAGIEVTLICDDMAGWLMKQGKINAVITGADRIAANGDTANKIGTYSLSILAAGHGIPFYVAAPSSTFDLSIQTGRDIPIEQRPPREVSCFGSETVAPEGISIFNPAFDVTDARKISAIITEKAVIEHPDAEKIARHLR